MTIDPKDTIQTKRNKIPDRINDYRKSLTQWKKLPYRVIALESSGYGNPFKDLLQDAPNIQYISKLLPHIPERGKGYGEAQTLKYLVDNIVKDDEVYIIKFTGRYAPINSKDLSKILHLLKKHKPNILVRKSEFDFKESNTLVPYIFTRSEWFVMKRKFLKDFAEFTIKYSSDRYAPNLPEVLLRNFISHINHVICSNLNIKVVPTNSGGKNELIKII